MDGIRWVARVTHNKIFQPRCLFLIVCRSPCGCTQSLEGSWDVVPFQECVLHSKSIYALIDIAPVS